MLLAQTISATAFSWGLLLKILAWCLKSFLKCVVRKGGMEVSSIVNKRRLAFESPGFWQMAFFLSSKGVHEKNVDTRKMAVFSLFRRSSI